MAIIIGALCMMLINSASARVDDHEIRLRGMEKSQTETRIILQEIQSDVKEIKVELKNGGGR